MLLNLSLKKKTKNTLGHCIHDEMIPLYLKQTSHIFVCSPSEHNTHTVRSGPKHEQGVFWEQIKWLDHQ